MKKLSLLILMGTFVLSTDAQQNSSVILHNDALPTTKIENFAHLITPQKQPKAHQNSGNKNTNINSGWFNYFDQIQISGGLYYWNTYQDSSLYDSQAGASMFFWGFGVSFDPTDSAFSYTYNHNNPNLITPTFAITNNNAYEIDSMYIDGKYMRNQNYTDSLILEAVVVNTYSLAADTTNGTYLIQSPSGYSYTWAADGAPRFANATYDGPNNQLSNSIIATKQRYAMALDAAVNADTTAFGGTFSFIMSPALQVPAGAKVVTYAHFKSGYAYPVGTTTENANYFRFYVGDPASGVAPLQSSSNPATGYPGSYEAGLMGDTYAAYAPPFWVTGQRMLVPDCQWANPVGVDAPDWGFFVKCTTCTSLDVPNIKNIVSSNAYPNPANTELYIPFTLATSADVTIALTNTIGQIVKSQEIYNITTGKASFNTSDLVGGIYFYTINAGNQHATGHVLIGH